MRGTVDGDGSNTRGPGHVLEPLLKMSTYSRLKHGETLLPVVELGYDKTVDVARHLDVSPSTVSPRVRRLKALFGHRLHEAQWRREASIALHVALPIWQQEYEESRRRRGLD